MHVRQVCCFVNRVAGNSAAALLCQVLVYVGKALGNRENLQRLMLSCTDLMGILAGHLMDHDSVTTPRLNAHDQQPWLSVMGRFESLLKVGVFVIGFTEAVMTQGPD